MIKPNVTWLTLLLASVAWPAASFGQETSQALTQDLAFAAPADASSSASSTSDAASPAEASGLVEASASAANASRPKKPDINEKYYYRNKVEFSLEGGVLPINIPFAFDAFVGDPYTQNPLHYTLVPVFPSLRWQMGKISGPWILRGNMDMTVTFSVTAIPRGPENIYDAFDLGFRRNFVYRNWKVTPYFEPRIGAGFINAQEPYVNTYTKQGIYGNSYSQGQNFTFTLMVGFGLRYNFNSKYSMEVGGTYMHVSNAYLSEPKYDDNGINVCGPWIGINMRLSRPKD